MAIFIILLGIIIFIFGFVTPVNDLITLPISIIVITFGIYSLLKRKKRFN